jgi:hypothetical protein
MRDALAFADEHDPTRVRWSSSRPRSRAPGRSHRRAGAGQRGDAAGDGAGDDAGGGARGPRSRASTFPDRSSTGAGSPRPR